MDESTTFVALGSKRKAAVAILRPAATALEQPELPKEPHRIRCDFSESFPPM